MQLDHLAPSAIGPGFLPVADTVGPVLLHGADGLNDCCPTERMVKGSSFNFAGAPPFPERIPCMFTDRRLREAQCA